MLKKIAAVLSLAIVAVLMTACGNTQTTASQCAYKIKNGYFDARHVENILHPGERDNSTNQKTKYVYCNARNYLVSAQKGANVDQTSPIDARTGKSSDGDGTPVQVELGMHWTLNQNEPVMLEFLGFAEKYGAFAPKDSSSSARSASEGWINMTQENHRFALQRAVQVALLDFKPDIWNDQSQWPKVADAISAQLKAELRNQIGSDVDFFCGVGVKLKPGKNPSAAEAFTCPEISVTLDNVAPQDEGVRKIYNQQVQQQQLQQLAVQEKKTNEAQLRAAKAKYGPLAEYFLGLQDTCKSNTCIIGNTGGSQIKLP